MDTAVAQVRPRAPAGTASQNLGENVTQRAETSSGGQEAPADPGAKGAGAAAPHMEPGFLSGMLES